MILPPEVQYIYFLLPLSITILTSLCHRLPPTKVACHRTKNRTSNAQYSCTICRYGFKYMNQISYAVHVLRFQTPPANRSTLRRQVRSHSAARAARLRPACIPCASFNLSESSAARLRPACKYAHGHAISREFSGQIAASICKACPWACNLSRVQRPDCQTLDSDSHTLPRRVPCHQGCGRQHRRRLRGRRLWGRRTVHGIAVRALSCPLPL